MTPPPPGPSRPCRGRARAARRAELLAAIDPDWRPAWPVDWQCHYATLKGLLTSGSGLRGVGEVPGAMVHGMDLGRWLQAQRQEWARLSEGQRERLIALGVEPAEQLPAAEAPLCRARPSRSRTAAFERGVAALAQYTARAGTVTVPRAHVEQLDDGTKVKLGVFLSTTKTRRARLTADQLQQLAGLGLEWAADGSH
ncbi:helicase associated domain-containing protein [Streptomyces sp. NPDC008141]|uniref:helicase associated domain-containing protein n=1 Tax=Streptomyces sp. NPDC008141 TaxID=3364815 RepID=UPI0036E4B85D